MALHSRDGAVLLCFSLKAFRTSSITISIVVFISKNACIHVVIFSTLVYVLQLNHSSDVVFQLKKTMSICVMRY